MVKKTKRFAALAMAFAFAASGLFAKPLHYRGGKTLPCSRLCLLPKGGYQGLFNGGYP